MQYYDDMQSKWGFDDGNAVPAGIEEYRKVYVATINHLLEQYDSRVRVIAWDRSGVHNSCLMIEVTPAFYGTLKTYQQTEGISGDLPPEALAVPDDAYHDAIHTAMDLDLDGFVHSVVEAQMDALYDWLDTLDTGKEDN